MSGTLWIISYVVLFAGVLVALAVSLATARHLGQVIVGGGHDDGRDDPHAGLALGSAFPDLVIKDLEGRELRPATWPAALVCQVVVRNAHDVAVFEALPALIPPQLHESTVISAYGDPALLAEAARLAVPMRFSHDADLIVDHAVKTKFRPHAVLVLGGRVVGTKSFASPPDLQDFVVATLAEHAPHLLDGPEQGPDGFAVARVEGLLTLQGGEQ